MLLQVGILDVGASGFPLLNLGLINKWYGHGQEEQKLKENFSNGQEVLDFARQRKKRKNSYRILGGTKITVSVTTISKVILVGKMRCAFNRFDLPQCGWGQGCCTHDCSSEF